MEFEIVGIIPDRSQWADATFMDHAYLQRVLQEKKSDNDGKVDVAWLMVADQEAAQRVSVTIENHLRDLKCETLSKAFSRWLAPLRDFLWGIEYIVAPAIMIVMIIIIANAVGITVRERTKEMAILKVLGFSKTRILILVLSEGALIGFLAGMVGGGLTQWVVERCGGIQMAEGNPFFVSWHAWWWGPSLGVATAILGGILPAWNACRVKVSEVFARVA
jgi:putative ABC transport system permease protein